jgi:hypothetical protein
VQSCGRIITRTVEQSPEDRTVEAMIQDAARQAKAGVRALGGRPPVR